VLPNELKGKNVIASAKNIGSVSDLEIDPAAWKVTHLRVGLTDDMVNFLGYHKPLRGKVQVLLSTGMISAVGDFVALNINVNELKAKVGKKEAGIDLGERV
jgi:sporulation protein YlmC with PRC-barrel domain